MVKQKSEDTRIIEIVPHPDKYLSCNICRTPNNKEGFHEISLGKDNNSLSIRMCDRCLNDFADKLWQYMEEGK